MNCVLYARVSTDKQAEKELSIPAQLQAMRDYARQHGWPVVEEFLELGASGRTADRPALTQLLQRCRRSPKVDIVLVHKLDRFARSVAQHATIKVLLKQRGIRLASVVENVDDTVSGQLVEHIMASIAEFYSANLGEEAKKGMRQKVLSGGWPHKPPCGYRVVRDESGKSRVVVDHDKAAMLKHAFERYASGLHSLNELRRMLATEGLLTTRGKPFSQEMLRQVLMNPFYAGRLRWKGTEYAGNHDPIVGEHLFRRVQRALQRRQKDSGEKGKHHFLLRGFSYCASCGGKLTAEHHPRGSYYRCLRNTTMRMCQAPFSNVKVAHDSIERVLDDLAVPARLCAALLDASERIIDGRVAAAAQHMRASKMRKAKLETREAALAETFAAGELSLRAYRSVMAKVRTEIAAVEESIATCKIDPELLKERVRQTIAAAARLRGIYDALDAGRRSQFLRLVFARILLEKGEVVGYKLHSPFDALFSETPSDDDRSDTVPRSPFDDRQVTPAINAILEHDVSPILTLSNELKAA